GGAHGTGGGGGGGHGFLTGGGGGHGFTIGGGFIIGGEGCTIGGLTVGGVVVGGFGTYGGDDLGGGFTVIGGKCGGKCGGLVCGDGGSHVGQAFDMIRVFRFKTKTAKIPH
ncbi:hypothetical protein M8C21_016567, partial [Ambrosia artemisiifolia]